MAMTLAALATEINTDPASLGYAALLTQGNDQGIADALNLVRAGAPYVVFREPMPSWQLLAQIDATELAALTAVQLQRLQFVFGQGTVQCDSSNVRSIVGALFGAGTTSRTNLQAFVSRQGSRAEVLWGASTVITAQNVAASLGRS